MQLREARAEKIRLARSEGNRKYWLMTNAGFVLEGGIQKGMWRNREKNRMLPVAIYKKLNHAGLEQRLKSLGFQIAQ